MEVKFLQANTPRSQRAGQANLLVVNLKTSVARAESSQDLGIMTAYLGGIDHLIRCASPCAALILKRLVNLYYAQMPFQGEIASELAPDSGVNPPARCGTDHLEAAAILVT